MLLYQGVAVSEQFSLLPFHVQHRFIFGCNDQVLLIESRYAQRIMKHVMIVNHEQRISRSIQLEIISPAAILAECIEHTVVLKNPLPFTACGKSCCVKRKAICL